MESETRSRRPRRWPALMVLAVLPLLGGAAPAPTGEPAKPDPAAILRATARAYSGLRSLQVQVRTEIPFPEGKPKVFQLGGKARAEVRGTLVEEHEWRITRDQALRVRMAYAGSRGSCFSNLPDRVITVSYDTGKTAITPPSRPLLTFRSWDNKWSTGYCLWRVGLLSSDLPFRLFLTKPPDAVLAADRMEYVRTAQEAGRDCHVLRLSVSHTIVPGLWTRTDRMFRSATWTLWIDRENSLIWRAEVKENWDLGPASDPEKVKPGVLEARETYRNQLPNADFAPEDFLPEPLDPVKPAEKAPKEKADPAAPAKEEGPGDKAAGTLQAPKALDAAQPGVGTPKERANQELLIPGTGLGEEAPAPPRDAVRRPPTPWEPPSAMSGWTRYLIFPLRIHVFQSEHYLQLRSGLKEADVTRILGKVNRIYAQMGIQFYLELLRCEPPDESHVTDHPPDQEAADFVLALRPAGSLAPRMFHLYYLRDMMINGSSLQNDGVFVIDQARLREVEGGIDEPVVRVTAHELGHRFTLGHRRDSTGLMCPGWSGVLLDEAEIKRARSAAQILGFGLSPAAALERAKGASREERLGILRCLSELPGPSDVQVAAAARLRRLEGEGR